MSSKLAKDYKADRPGVVSRAPAFEVEFVSWLERMVVHGCDHGMSEQDRLTLGRLRICIGASLRHDDLKRTSTSTYSFLMEHESVVVRGLVGCAVRTKTQPRHWVCSGHSVSGPLELSGLEATIKLLRTAHGAGWGRDDHTGKSCNGEATRRDALPVSHYSDMIHVRRLMAMSGHWPFAGTPRKPP